ncbi:HAMP domain-containing histidine kinase [Luteimonas sp. BDR2-5]|uniref:sensor histidine kinase n=1 Tax=Proluteimonas luteida TaxID=2878685 RepID=UPI001E5C2C83|nr:HAMP domain-containing sensor histidine kinase [Luteimonas sp. BDR2-5]MCD9027915.1 HAMP domain-containing histidine kinase [Luteimonas sp. BDR2-5]
MSGLRGELLRTTFLPVAVLALAAILVAGLWLRNAATQRFEGDGQQTGRAQVSVPRGVEAAPGHGVPAPLRQQHRRIAIGCALAAIAVLAALAAVLLRIDGQVLRPLRALADDPRCASADGRDELAAVQARIDGLLRRIDDDRQLLLQHTRQSAHYQADAARAGAGRAQFLAVVGDRLRQPLQAIELFVASLQRHAGTPAQHQAIERLQQSANAARRLLDELLLHARLEAGVVQVQPARVEIRALFATLQAAMIAGAAADAPAMRWRDNALAVRSDPALLSILLQHLVANARDSAAGGRVLVAARRRGRDVRLEVRDNGVGIAGLHQGQIFETFFQLSRSERHRERRLGLGLPICARIATLLGSDIGMRSALGRGSVFWIDLPAAATVDPTRPGAAADTGRGKLGPTPLLPASG